MPSGASTAGAVVPPTPPAVAPPLPPAALPPDGGVETGVGGQERGRGRGRLSTLTSPAGLLCAAALVMSCLPATSFIRDPDFWWHLRTGQLILDRHGLLGADPFTYTVPDHHWVMHEWLTEVLFALMYRAGGLGLIVLVLCVTTWAGLVCLAGRAALPLPPWAPRAAPGHDGRRVSLVVLGLGMVLASVAGYPIWGPRAQMVTFALTCLTLLLAERHLRLGGRGIWLLVPIFLVWSNLHAGFIIGAAFLGVIAGVELVAGRLRLPGSAPTARVVGLVKVIAACALIVVINPNGPGIYLYPFETQGSSAQQSLILEWHSPDFHDTAVRAFGLMLLSLAVMCVVTRRVRPRDLALALLTTALALQSVRHIALFVAAVTPLWIEQAGLCGDRVRAWRRSGRPAPAAASGAPRPAVVRRQRVLLPARPAPPQPPVWFRVSLTAAVVGIPLLFLAGRTAGAVATREDSATYTGDFPVCASRWLAAAPAGLDLRIFNQYGEGGYLALHLTPLGDRVYIFGDAALMGDAMLHRYGGVEGISPSWETEIIASGTDIVVFDNGTPLVDVLGRSPDWRLVYRDGHNSALVRADAAGDRLRAVLPDASVVTSTTGCSAATTSPSALAVRP